jgi:ABC-type glycerol-3-phosphate transport system substrate-binding protein
MRAIPIIAAALALAACGRPQQQDSHSVTLTVPGANGPVVIGNQLPANLPDFVKVYPGAKVTATTTTPGGGVVAMESGDSPDQVMDFYKKSASGSGLPVQMDSATMGAGGSGASHLVVFGGQAVHKSLNVSVQAQNGVTKIAIIYGMQAS